jgi:SAM-dependent methyltransferase
MLILLRPGQTVLPLAAAALAASVLASGFIRQRGLAMVQGAWLVALLALAALPAATGLKLSEFKGLSQALEVVGSRVVAETSSPLGMLTVVENTRIPFRHAPGLSFAARHLPPDQLAVFTDGEAMSALNHDDGSPDALAYLDDTTAALPYRLLERPSVLVLGAGAGSDVALALRQGARKVDAVELNPHMSSLVADRFADYAGRLYTGPRVTLHTGEARGFAARSGGRFDLIQIGLLDSFGVAGSGVQALNENYLYTVEAIRRYLQLLEPDGLLAITRWLRVPPRDSLKLAATAIEALRRDGIAEPGGRLAAIRSWNTFTLLVRNGEFDAQDGAKMAAFTRRLSFDSVWYPAMPHAEANRYNRLEQAWFHEGIRALLDADAPEFIGRYKFRLAPAVDDRPYFFHFFKWAVLPEVLSLRERGGAGLIEWGYPVLAATLLQALIAGSLLILLPLTATARNWPRGHGKRWGGYFFLLGLAFLFIEMAFIQKFILFLGHPLYSVTVVLAGFLLFAGFGSAASAAVARRLGSNNGRALPLAVTAISGLVLLYIVLLPPVFALGIGWPDASKAVLALILIAPLAFCMGLPFPLGLRHLAKTGPGFIPWAWGLNGFASVVSAAAATLLAVHLGFTAVLLAAISCYLAAALLLRR